MAKERGLFFTVCPYANEMMRPGHQQQVVRGMIDNGLRFMLNSDDPAYMEGNYITENMIIAQRAVGLTKAELLAISRNAFDAAWIDDATRAAYNARLDAFAAQQGL